MKNAREPFESSVRALRDVTGPCGDGDVTRLRVLSRLAEQKRRRHDYAVVLLGALLLMTVPAVSAGWRYLQRGAPTSPQNHEATKRSSIAMHARPPAGEERQRITSPSPAVAPATRAAAEPSELLLYEQAHEAHFHAQDFRKALRLWMGYVRHYPRGRFLPEAQFNRAVCLVRLGDTAAARAVLHHLLESAGPEHPRAQASQLLAELE